MRGDAAKIIFALAAFVGLGGYFYLFISRSSALLRQWLKENQYQLLRAEPRVLRRGPFWWSSKSQAIYRVEVRDRAGTLRKGWVRLGSWLRGVFSDQVEVRWDDEQGPHTADTVTHLDHLPGG
jgi:hypothetical protein